MEPSRVIKKAMESFMPPPDMTNSEWADERRYVAKGPRPGKWDTMATPQIKEPMDMASSPDVSGLVIVKPTRSSGTELINNTFGRRIDIDPCDMLYVQSTDEVAQKYSSSVFMARLVQPTAVLKNKIVSKIRGMKVSDTIARKSFPGGELHMFGAKSHHKFTMVDYKVVVFDDVAKYEKLKSGDPIEAGIGRTKGFWDSISILVSNPGEDGLCPVQPYFEKTNQCHRYVPCPRCGEFQILKFGDKDSDFGLKWDVEEVWYECEHCHGRIKESEKRDMDLNGEWRPHCVATASRWLGYKLNPFVHPWHRWREDFIDRFLSCKGDSHKLKTFVTEYLGEWYIPEDRLAIEPETLYARREIYHADIPQGVKILTAAVDTQDDRLECVVMGWSSGEESWIIEHRVFVGSPVEKKIWDTLDNYLLTSFNHEDGNNIKIQAVNIDTGGHFNTQVYDFTKSREGRGVIAVHGSNNLKAPTLDGEVQTHKGNGAKYQRIGVSTCKDTLIGRLKIEEQGHGYIHIPMSIDIEFCKQLLGESKNKKTGKWEPIPGRRNEAMDLYNYNLAALHGLRVNWEAIERGTAIDMGRGVYRQYQMYEHIDASVTIDPNYPIIVSFNFGENPLTCVFIQTDSKKVWVFDELYVSGGDATYMARETMRRYGGHSKGIKVYGSAKGSIRSGAGKTEYAILSEYGLPRPFLRRMDASPTDRVNAVNNMLEDMAGDVRLTIHPNCINLRDDFELCLWKRDMREVDRIDFGRGNTADALSHYIMYEHPLRAKRNQIKKHWKA